jgi:uncharacterized iron-regulated membrane protein
MTLRKVLFWCHLCVGVTAGIVIMIMSVTGVLLTYERQIMLRADTRSYNVDAPASGARRLPLDALIEKARERERDVTSVTLRARSDAPAAFGAEGRTLYLNPYTGEFLGDGAPGVRRFFRQVTDWHRWLAMQGERRDIGRALTGACNLAFLFIVASAFYLWWPRTWTKQQLRSVTLFNGRLRGKARDFNWHNVIGFWSAVPLFVIVLGSVVISYPWASDLVYRAVGEQPPVRQQRSAANRSAGARSAQRGEPRRREIDRKVREEGDGVSATNWEALWVRAERQMPEWRSINLRLPASADADAVFTIDAGTGGQPQKRATLTLNQDTSEVVRWEPYSRLSPGRQIRTWLRFAHTGEVYGIAGQTIAGVASLGAVVLAFTGMALSVRRFQGWRALARNGRRVVRQPRPSPSAAAELSKQELRD